MARDLYPDPILDGELPTIISEVPTMGPVTTGNAKNGFKRKNRQYKRGRRGMPISLTQAQFDELKLRVTQGWNNTQIYHHYAAQWNRSTAVIRTFLDKIYAEWTADAKREGRDLTASRAKIRLEGYLKEIYDIAAQCEDPLSKAKILNNASYVLVNLARIERAFEVGDVNVAIAGGVTVANLDETAVRDRIKELLKKHNDKINAPGPTPETKPPT